MAPLRQQLRHGRAAAALGFGQARARHRGVGPQGRPARTQAFQRMLRLDHGRARRMRHGRRQGQQLQALLPQLGCRVEQATAVAVQRLRRVVEAAAHGAAQVGGVRAQGGQPVGARRGRQFGRRRRRGCAQVGREVGDGEIRLVAHAADHRHGTVGDRMRDGFIVE
ncbi:hypothetical protein D3C81_711500 [compost metagenome]